ncbi:MAG: thrombospondin type 3 repeat-containing protein [Patescibacteria group bacterium]
MRNKDKKTEEILDADQKIVKEPSFGVHKMPKSYKTGRFDSVFHGKKDTTSANSVLEEKNKQQLNSKGKKIGFLIVFFGIIFISGLAYSAFLYIKNPEANIFNFSALFERKNVIEDPTIEDEQVVEEVIEEEVVEEEIIEEEIIEEEVVEEEVVEENPVLSEINDSDGDGLNDLEEIILGTNLLSSDTDNDGFDDLTEVLNLYNPVGSGSILENGNISEYKNEIFSYSIFYPIAWEIKALSDSTSVNFFINQDSFVQVLVEENELKKDIVDWYFSRFFEIVDDSLVLEVDGLEGVLSPNKDSFYLTDGDKVYSIFYSLSPRGPEYPNIFRMMINSFKLR